MAETTDTLDALKMPAHAKTLLTHIARKGGGEFDIVELGEALGVTKAIVDRAGRYLVRNGYCIHTCYDKVTLPADSIWIKALKKKGPASAAAKRLKEAHATIEELRVRVADLESEVGRLRNVQGQLVKTEQLLHTAAEEAEAYRVALERSQLGG